MSASEGPLQMGDRMLRLEGMLVKSVEKLDGGWTKPPLDFLPSGMHDRCTALATQLSLPPDTAVEDLVHNDVEAEGDPGHHGGRSSPSTTPYHGAPALGSDGVCDTNMTSTECEQHAPSHHSLYQALPSDCDHDIICRACRVLPGACSDILTRPFRLIEQIGLQSVSELQKMPQPDKHPVLIARHLLQLATMLQHVNPKEQPEIKQLSTPLSILGARMADAAISFVISQEKLLGNLEGLECLMLESLYQAHAGNMRLSWLACRRALSLGQLMGLHRPDDLVSQRRLDFASKADPAHMWFRLNYYDRHMSLLLGMPQGSMDRSLNYGIAFEQDTPLGQLERFHCVLNSQILERNESGTLRDFELTMHLDRQLQQAARCLPSKWWLLPALRADSLDHQALFWHVQKIMTQMLHFNILNQLHLPFMLLPSSSNDYAYSKIACMNASREILSRFSLIRSLSCLASTCRTADFLAFQASITLLLAHLDTQSSREGTFLGHQYLTDRAMIEQVQDSMAEVDQVGKDALSREIVDVLRRLLSIEAEAEQQNDSLTVQSLETKELPGHGLDGDGVRLQIPYFGAVKISRAGQVSKASADVPAMVTGSIVGEHDPRTSSQAMLASSMKDTATLSSHANRPASARLHGAFGDPMLPELTAGADEWTFQGVDMAYFDNSTLR